MAKATTTTKAAPAAKVTKTKKEKAPAAAAITVRQMAGAVVDIAIGAKVGTTTFDRGGDVVWHSPAVRVAYAAARAALGNAKASGSSEYNIPRPVFDAFLAAQVAKAAKDPDAYRRKYAHTKASGWVRYPAEGEVNTPLPFLKGAKTTTAKTTKAKAPKKAKAAA